MGLTAREDRTPDSLDDRSESGSRSPIDRFGPAVVWTIASVVVLGLAYKRDHAALQGRVGGDFSFYFHAARAVAAGHSPYSVAGYVYPPLIAIVLAPLAHVATPTVWKLWVDGTCLILVAAALLATFSLARQLSPLQRPLLFGIAGVTALHFWPTTVIFFLGQADPIVLALLAASVLATERGRSKTAGVMLGLAGLAKAWPAAAAVSAFRRRYQRRWPTIVAFVVTVVLAPVLALAPGGLSELSRFVRDVFDARSQHLISDSVWGVSALNFSRSGLARPVVVSAPLEVIMTIVLLGWVVGLVVLTLRTPGPGFGGVLAFWNVAFCIVLLLPVSHLAYTIIGLPLLWSWTATLMTRWRPPGRWRRPEGTVLAVTLVLVLWWLVLNKAWPGYRLIGGHLVASLQRRLRRRSDRLLRFGLRSPVAGPRRRPRRGRPIGLTGPSSRLGNQWRTMWNTSNGSR